MKIFEKKLTDLREYENNPRNNAKAVDAVAESIAEFGFKVPIIIDSDGVIIAGHTRKKAAEKLGLEKVPCIIAEDLTHEQIKAFRLADNKTAELAEWDFAKLEAELAELSDIDMSAFGFEDLDIPSEVGLDREDIGVAAQMKQLKYGSTTFPLTEEEAQAFEDSYESYLAENGTLFGFISSILGGTK